MRGIICATVKGEKFRRDAKGSRTVLLRGWRAIP
jgi:hypothetical protein